MNRLRESARWCPHCMSCGYENPNHNELCLAHSNRQRDGKGMALKSLDEKGAIVCDTCHKTIDGPFGLHMSREQRQTMHTRAHIRTVRWWVKTGYLTAERGEQLLRGAA